MQLASTPIFVPATSESLTAETLQNDWYLVTQGHRVVYAYDPAVYPEPLDVIDHICSIEYDHRGDARMMQLFTGGILEDFAVWRGGKLAATFEAACHVVEYQNVSLMASR